MKINVNCPPRGLFIGRETENVARTLAVDFSAWAAEHGHGTLQVLLQRPGDATPYPVTLTVDGTVATWRPSETDLAEAGTGAVQLVYTTAAGVREKTQIIPVMVEPSLGVESDPPEGWTSWLDQLTDLAAVTEQHAANAAESAENAGDSATDAQQYANDAGDAKNAAVAAAEAAAASVSHYPQIVNGVWYVWSPTAGAYISTGIDAQGEDGVSPTVEITAIQGGHRVVITDAEGSHTFDVMDGVTPDLSAYRTAADQDEIDDAQDEELNNLKSAIEALDSLVDRKAGMLVDTASGAIASFVPDSTIPDLLGVSVAVEPVQDLHGYDAPWPAGGGKNKLASNATKDVTIAGQQTIVVSLTKNVAEITIDRDLTVSIGYRFNDGSIEAVLPAGGYFFSTNITNQAAGSGLFIFDATTSKILGKARAEGGAYISLSTETTVRLGLSLSAGTKAGVYWFQLEAGTTATAFAPYENICPISGRESVEVEAAGKNLFDPSGLSFITCFDYSGNEQTRRGKRLDFPAGVFTFSAKSISGNQAFIYINICNSDGTLALFDYAIGGQTEPSDKHYTLTDGQYILIFDAQARTEADVNKFEYYNIQIELGSTATEYEPYQGTTHTIPLPETVYGGDVGVVSGSGEKKMGMVDLGTLSWIYYVGSGYTMFISNVLETIKPVAGWQGICSMYPLFKMAIETIQDKAISTGYSDQRLRIKDTSYTDATAFKAAMSGVMLCYELATPTPISTTPTEISTVEGENNVFSPDGDVTVDYAADLKTYIDNKIAAAVAAMS